MTFIARVCAAIAISSVGMLAAPPTGTEKVTPAAAAQARNLTQDVTAVGCIRAWKPAPEDVTKFPENRQPGVAGIYLLTPLASSPTASIDLPTYLLTPTQVVNFFQHLDDKVEVVGVAQAAPLPPTVQETVTAPTMRPENRPSVQSIPRLTVKSMKKLSDSCPS